MKKTLIVSSLIVGMIGLVGCGSDDDSNNDSGDTSKISGTPITSKIVCDSGTQTFGTVSIHSKFYAEGDIQIECKTIQGFSIVEYGLSENISQLNITQITQVEYLNFQNSKKGSFTGKATYDYQKGTIDYDVILNGEKITCKETYQSILPKTLTKTTNELSDEIEELLDWGGEDNALIDSTCPSSLNDEDEDEEDSLQEGSRLANYTITDDKNKKHLLAVEFKISK